MKNELQFRADKIDGLLASNGIPTQITGGTVTPRLTLYRLSEVPGLGLAQVASLSEEIAKTLGVPSCRVYREQGEITIEVPREQSQIVHLMPLARRLAQDGPQGVATVPPTTAVLGLDTEGVPLLLRLPSRNVGHVLVAGGADSGKTALLRTIVASLALHNPQRALQLVLVDPKRQGLSPFARLPHLLGPVVTDAVEATEVLGRLVEEIERRNLEDRREPRLIVVLDELADLVQGAGEEVERQLAKLLHSGREAGIHVVASVRTPVSSRLERLIKANFPVRLVGVVDSPEDAEVAAGLAGSGAERLLAQGDFMVVAKGQVARMQAAYISDEDLGRLIATLTEQQTPRLTAVTKPQGQQGRRPVLNFRGA